MSNQNNVVELFPVDKDRSSVREELDALDYQLGTIARSIHLIEKHNSISNEWELQSVKRAIDRIAQRAYRAEQCSRGLKVWKA
ncbi:hypothetical protein OTK49_02220 [Vibrio coralliirubri]|uniref:hypothetical protein n=1 Tax=Vibrio coralliirubri TaxID=1516159 RepID=UPI0022836E07|nr:hypothetical protein [Vibrio coralliirubri]MCY9861331.1 hypothetical protein [Vibrio coralliirubri]